MHSKSTAGQTAGQPSTDLVLERYGAGYAWLRPASDRRYILPSRYRLTDRGRRALAEYALFGPCPTGAQRQP